jgi:predicted metalloendopeptidase
VELKASPVYRAVDQLRASMEKLSADLTKLPKRCSIVFNRNPMIGTDLQKLKAQFWQKFISHLELVKDRAERRL